VSCNLGLAVCDLHILGAPVGQPEANALLYDADCGFCRWVIGQILRWDRRGRLVPVQIQSATGERLLADVPEDERLESWHLVGEDGRLRSAGAAFAPLLRVLPAGRLLAWLPEKFPRAATWGYRYVAGRRQTVSRFVPRHAKVSADARIRAREGDVAPPVVSGRCLR
jgi:predicted DCC family thiol-disulfide oxidoreductase YuxK